MIKHITIALFLLLLLTGCLQSPQKVATEAPVLFVTSTLPPTKPGLTVPTQVPPTASPTLNPTDPTPTPSCRDGALFVEDVTYPDHTRLNAGERFTKTWKLKNTGTCPWTGYQVAFVSGDRMEAPGAVPIPETGTNLTVDISVDLVAPATDGSYSANFELQNAQGERIPLGTEPTFWVRIVVGDEIPSASEQTIGNCTYTENPAYVQTLIDLINQARADTGRAALTVDADLTEAARRHSLDMACSDFMKHSGSDGSWTGDRVTDAGYTNPYYLEILAIGLPQDAINQWRIEPRDWDMLINSRVTEIGVGYIFSKFSSYGGYWTVVMGGP